MLPGPDKSIHMVKKRSFSGGGFGLKWHRGCFLELVGDLGVFGPAGLNSITTFRAKERSAGGEDLSPPGSYPVIQDRTAWGRPNGIISVRTRSPGRPMRLERHCIWSAGLLRS